MVLDAAMTEEEKAEYMEYWADWMNAPLGPYIESPPEESE